MSTNVLPLPGSVNFLDVCDRDERIQIDPRTSPPYNWICELRVQFPGGPTVFGATGWLINIPNANNRVIVTARHALQNAGGLATVIQATFPGFATLNFGPADLRISTTEDYGGDSTRRWCSCTQWRFWVDM